MTSAIPQLSDVKVSASHESLGLWTIPRRVLHGLFPHSTRWKHPVVAYPEFVELQQREEVEAQETGEPVRFEWDDVQKFTMESEG